MTRILITGVRGKTGLPLAQQLAARGDVTVRGGSSDPSGVAVDGVEPVAFSWDDPRGWPAAVADADAVFLVRPDRADAPERLAQLLPALPAAARVVLLSERDTDAFADDEWSPRVERVVREGGRPWTILRPSWFMQVLSDARFYRDELLGHGRLPFAGGGATVAWIDARDIAAVAACALLDDAHDGRTHELSGPEALTLPRTAAVLAEALGRPVEHVEVSIEAAAADLPDGFERDELVWTLERLRDGGFSGVTSTVEDVTGRPARTLAAFAAELA